MERSDFIFRDPEIPLSLVENKNEKVSRWLPHVRGKEVECRLWQMLPCTFRFYFDGWLQLGPGRPYWIYLAIILPVVSTCFVIFDVLPYGESLAAIFNGFFVLTIVSIALYNLLVVVSKDPGYLLPHWFSKQTHQIVRDERLTFSEITARYGYSAYCCICKIFQKPDTFHCKECHACIEAGDHHCTLLGTCVGRRNYRSFFIFVLATDFGLWLATIVSFTHFVQGWISKGPAHAFSNAVTLYVLLSTLMLPPGGMYVISVLPFYHFRLMYLGITLEQKRSLNNPAEVVPPGLTWNQKVLRFWMNFYIRVIETPPPSQITSEILRLKVKMPAIPRTNEVYKYHLNLQGVHSPRKIRIIFSSAWMERIFSYQRMALIQRDIETYGSFAILPSDLIRIQELRRKQKRKDQANKWRQSRMNSYSPRTLKLPKFLMKVNTVGDAPTTNGIFKCVPDSQKTCKETHLMINVPAPVNKIDEVV